MKRFMGVLVAVAVLAPGAAEAQKNNRYTRSAEVYLNNAANEAVTADKIKHLQSALEAAQQSIQSEPDNARGYLLAGRAYMGLNDLAGADSSFDRAEQLHAAYAEETQPFRLNAWIAAFNKGVGHIQAGQIDEAIAAMEQANAIYRGRPEAFTTVAQLYMQKGDMQKAEQAFRAGLEILRGPARQGLSAEDEEKWSANESDAVLLLAGLLADTQRDEEAATLYREFLQRQPQNALARTNLAVVLTRLGQADEAARIFNELLTMQDLEPEQLFNIGVGLFRAEQYERAAAAFERAVEAAPHSHDALYNLGQSIYAYSAELEDAKTAGDASATQKLSQVYTRMAEVAERILAIDPTNRNVYMMLAHANRSLGELASGAAADQHKRAALAALEKHEAIPFEVTGIRVTPGAAGKFNVTGLVNNVTAPEGSPLKINFQLVDQAGNVVGQQEITVNAGTAGSPTRFDAEIDAPDTVQNWKYVVVS